VFCDLDESYFHCVTGAMLRIHVDSNTPIRHVRNYLHPPKVMVVVLVCAPNSRLGRSGKVGMWRVAKDKVSKRSSSLRDVNVIYKKDITMDNDVYFDLWTRVGGIANALHQAFPNATTIYVQHDNAPAHVGKGVVDRILAEVNKNDLAAKSSLKVNLQTHLIRTCVTLVCFDQVKTEVRKQRSHEKHRNYMMKQLIDNDDDNDDEGELKVTAWEKYDSSKLTRLYETKPVVLAEIVKDNVATVSASSTGGEYRKQHRLDPNSIASTASPPTTPTPTLPRRQSANCAYLLHPTSSLTVVVAVGATAVERGDSVGRVRTDVSACLGKTTNMPNTFRPYSRQFTIIQTDWLRTT
jgi:hypothetical protein